MPKVVEFPLPDGGNGYCRVMTLRELRQFRLDLNREFEKVGDDEEMKNIIAVEQLVDATACDSDGKLTCIVPAETMPQDEIMARYERAAELHGMTSKKS